MASASGSTSSGSSTSGGGGAGGTGPSSGAIGPTSGNGRWHPVLSAQDPSPVPSLVQNLTQGLPVLAVHPFTSSWVEGRPYSVTFSTSCPAVQKSVVSHASTDHLTVQASGNVGALEWWVVVGAGPFDGANLSLVPGAAASSCELDGLPFTPVDLTLSGPMAGKAVGYTGVSCGSGADGVQVEIWGLPLTGGHGVATLVATLGSAQGPGAHTVTSDDSVALVPAAVYSWAQLTAIGAASGGAGAPPAGAIPLTGAVTLEGGEASGSLALSGGGETVKGTFDCGSSVTG